MYDGNQRRFFMTAGLRTHPFEKTKETAVTVAIMNGKLEGIERVDGYSWLVLLGKVSAEMGSLP